MGAALPAVALGVNVAGNVHAAKTKQQEQRRQAAIADSQANAQLQQANDEKARLEKEGRRAQARRKVQHARSNSASISNLSDLLLDDTLAQDRSLASLLTSSNNQVYQQRQRARNYRSQASANTINTGFRTAADLLMGG